MAKKPILTDDELDGGLPAMGSGPAGGAMPPPLPPSGGNSATRPVDTPPPPPPPPAPPPSSVTRPLDAAPPAPAMQPKEAPSSQMRPKEATPPPAASADASGRDASGHARPKTRIHGYGGPARDEADSMVTEAAHPVPPCVGWLVVTAGPGRGASLPLIAGMNALGRGADNPVMLDFGDDTISREPHAFVTYDDETRMFHLSHGGRTNLVRLNNAPVLTTEGLASGDTIRIGATSLRFVALCGPDFDWSDN